MAISTVKDKLYNTLLFAKPAPIDNDFRRSIPNGCLLPMTGSQRINAKSMAVMANQRNLTDAER